MSKFRKYPNPPLHDGRWTNIQPILEDRDSWDYLFVMGQRSTGKSYDVKQYLIDHFLETGMKFVRIVRRVPHVGKCSSYFDNMPDKFDIRWNKMKEQYEFEGRVFGYVWVLSQADTYRSGEYPDVDTVLFEEYVPLSVMNYLEDEVAVYNNIFSTINRLPREDVRGIFIGNTNNPSACANIYLDQMFGFNWFREKPESGNYYDITDYSTPEESARAYLVFASNPFKEGLLKIPRNLRVKHNAVTLGDELEKDKEVYYDYLLLPRDKCIDNTLFKVNKRQYIGFYLLPHGVFVKVIHKPHKTARIYDINNGNIMSQNSALKMFDAYRKNIELYRKENFLPITYTSDEAKYIYQLTIKMIDEKTHL